MAKVLVSLKIFPSNVEVNLDTLKKEIEKNLPEYCGVYKFEEEQIAFGLVALLMDVLIPEDLTGGIDKVENSLKKIEKISDIQTLMVRRV